MAELTDDADYDAGETFRNVSSPLLAGGNHDNYYGRRLRTRCILHSRHDNKTKRRNSSSEGVHHVMDCQTAAVHRGLAIVSGEINTRISASSSSIQNECQDVVVSDMIAVFPSMYRNGLTSFENVSIPLSDGGNHDNFGLGAFYINALTTRPSCDNEVNPLLKQLTPLSLVIILSFLDRK
ncbi:unnamed protein product [Protopolystoma xenopodis]|uniref:Uncharacterized protein n=1 Tax=Protopolystoma xenopodis TaxID=117903 RepID=A0A448WSD0_9PLAT|nr:unnamed protein product [Protopolystoma xenopodis]